MLFGNFSMAGEQSIVVARKKRSKLKTASFIGVPLVLSIAGYVYYSRNSDTFDGEISGWNVSYREGPQQSYMSAKKGDISVTYEDTETPEKINFKAKNPDILEAKLEAIIYTDPKGTERFCRKDLDPASFDFEVRNQIFAAADKHYNGIRAQIVKDIQKKQLDRLVEIRDSLK